MVSALGRAAVGTAAAFIAQRESIRSPEHGASGERTVTLVARAIVVIASLVFLILVVGIVLVVLDANPENVIVVVVTSVAGFLVGPFDGLFIVRDAQLETAINWGIAAFVWLVVGLLLAGLLRRAGGVAERPEGAREPRRADGAQGPRRDWRRG